MSYQEVNTNRIIEEMKKINKRISTLSKDLEESRQLCNDIIIALSIENKNEINETENYYGGVLASPWG